MAIPGGSFLKRLNPFKNILEETPTRFTKKSMPGIENAANKVIQISHEFDEVLQFSQDDRDREDEAWKLYSGIDSSQWDSEVKSELEKDGRNPFQGNFIRQKVDGRVGAMVKNFFDVKYEAVDSMEVDLTRLVSAMMYSDKELCNWEQSYIDAIKNGFIHVGVEEMYIEKKYSPLGNIGFRSIAPGHVLLDPMWRSNSTWDLRRLWKVSYMTPNEMKEIWNIKAPLIDAAIISKQNNADEFDNGDDSSSMTHFDLHEEYGSEYQVIEYHHMEREQHKVKFVVSKGIFVPEGTEEEQQEWAILNEVDLENDIIERNQLIDVYYVSVICPQLLKYDLLEDREGAIQIGRLPFFPWGVYRINGRFEGIPLMLKSLQQTYNKRESLLDDIIANSANGGMAMDPSIVDEDRRRMGEIEESWNKTNFRFWTAPGALLQGAKYFEELPRAQTDYGVVNEINRMLDMSDRISGQPAAADGRVESSDESGILFARKQLQYEIANTIIVKKLEQHWNDKGEAYLLLAKQLYSGIYREFVIPGQNKPLEINVPVYTPKGIQIVNDLSQLPRMKVVVTQSPAGESLKAVDREMNLELLRVLGPENPLQRQRAISAVMKTLNAGSIDKEKIEEDAFLEKQLARARIETELLSLQAQQAQISASMTQMQQPQQMPMPQAEAEKPAGGVQPMEKNPGENTPPPQGNPLASLGGSSKAAATPM